ncbi:MAG: hypothetical protein [Wendovervirus sonii]|uniref:Uncharacterized protein n=1 Tax=phage Lak_Megaphage_Sonny TaxID=3109229 RepID=A0ABZ0Z223_9CAUD|nr:MAG: hypothetical protein [phage Lak_Megaphage_Sonny]
MLEENKTTTRIDRHKVSQEDFTPRQIVELLFEKSEELFTDFSKTMIDPCAGVFYIIIYCFEKRLENCKTADDIIKAISTLYGTELFEDNVIEGRQNLQNSLDRFLKENNIEFNYNYQYEFNKILDSNFVATDTFKWDYENWCSLKEEIYESIELF